MEKTIVKSQDELLHDILEMLKTDKNSFGEPTAFVHVLQYNDKVSTMVSIKLTEEHDRLAFKEKPYYKAEIVITNEEAMANDDMVLISNGTGVEVIQDLIQDVVKIDFSSFCVL